jgi:hypothetical protein
MENRRTLRRLLQGGDRRSLGRAEEALAIVRRDPRKIGALMKCLWDSDPCIAMRAADVMEKISRERVPFLRRYKRELLGLAAETTQQELRWHLAVTIPRLQLTVAECERFAAILQNYLDDRSSIVKTFAMQGLFDLTGQNPNMREQVTELIRSLSRTGTAAMRARGRHLLKQLELR